MKYIVMSGDSHTCGQGATSFYIQDEPTLGYEPMGKGVGRNTDYATRCYVNLVREAIVRRTQSEAFEVTASDLAHAGHLPMVNRCAHLIRPLELPVGSDGLLVCFAEKKEAARVEILVDGVCVRTETLQADITRYGDWSFRYIPVDCAGAASVTFRPLEGDVYLYTMEMCSGRWAVVNSGVGSCPVGRYLKDYFDDCVAAFRPDIVVLEAHTINDWIHSPTPQDYARDLTDMIRRVRQIGATPVLLTVSPILGEQQINGHAPYEEYIAASLEVARLENVRIADAHALMAKRLEGRSEEEKKQDLFDDIWHVNDAGHKIYCDVVMSSIAALL